jgi:hypothetical protein
MDIGSLQVRQKNDRPRDGVLASGISFVGTGIPPAWYESMLVAESK